MFYMKNNIFSSILIISIFIVPAAAGAQYYSDRNWYGNQQITPSGPPEIAFPVEGGATFSDDFGDARSGHLHEGNDLKAPKMTPIVAARGGRVVYAPMLEPVYGYMISIAGDDGYEYNYIHINDDTPGTDDNNGGPQHAYAPGIGDGSQVIKGQHIAWVGDSGNAETTTPHLHFEIRMPDDTAINPYPYLLAALQIYTYDVVAAKADSATINSDKGLIVASTTVFYCVAGSLIRTPLFSTAYYCGTDGKRYVFPNIQTYNTWYKDFSGVQMISLEDMANIPLGGNVTYRPGVKLVKIQSDSKVYAVDRDGTLRLMTTPAIAAKYYGTYWSKSVEDIPVAFFTNYTIGNPVSN